MHGQGVQGLMETTTRSANFHIFITATTITFFRFPKHSPTFSLIADAAGTEREKKSGPNRDSPQSTPPHTKHTN